MTLQLSTALTASPTSTACRNIAFKNVLAQVREEENDDDKTLTKTICKNANGMQEAVAKRVPVWNDKKMDHLYRLATFAERYAGDTDVKDLVGDGTDKGTCSYGEDGVENGDGVGSRDANVDIGDGGHANRDIDSDMYDSEESDRNEDCEDKSDDEVDMAAIGDKVDVSLHGPNNQDYILDDDNATILELQALTNIFEFPDAPDFCLSDGEDLSESDLDLDDIDILQAETIIISSTKYRSMCRRLHIVLT